jgi:hypothetical protein
VKISQKATSVYRLTYSLALHRFSAQSNDEAFLPLFIIDYSSTKLFVQQQFLRNAETTRKCFLQKRNFDIKAELLSSGDPTAVSF